MFHLPVQSKKIAINGFAGFLIHFNAKFAKKYNAKNAEKYKSKGRKSLRPLLNRGVLCARPDDLVGRGFVFAFLIILNSF
jgi:hypothetical protein